MGQIFGKFYKFDDKFGNISREDIDINVINTEDLEDCLIVFWVEDMHAAEQLDAILPKEFIEDLGSSVLILIKSLVLGMDVIDITEVEKIKLRMMDPERAQRTERKEQDGVRQKALGRIIAEGEK